MNFLQEEKKKFDKQTEKYCLAVQNYLNLSSKKKDSFLSEVRCCTHLWIIYSDLFIIKGKNKNIFLPNFFFQIKFSDTSKAFSKS